MELSEIALAVASITDDIPSVKWEASTYAFVECPISTRAFSGRGKQWSHNFIFWKDESGETRCEGSAVHKETPLVVRYIPEQSKLVLKALQDGGFCE